MRKLFYLLLLLMSIQAYSQNPWTPYTTSTGLRSGVVGTPDAVILTDKQGYTFKYDSSNTTAADDSAMVIRYGSRRYERVTDVIRPEFWGAVPDGGTNCTIAFMKAAATGKTILLSKGRYVGNITLNKQKLIGQGYSSGWGSGNVALTIIQGTVTMSHQSLIENLNVEDSPANGINVRGAATTVRNVGVHKSAGHGIDYGGNANLNHFKLDGFYSTYNSGWGIQIDHADIYPNANAGTIVNVDVRGNTLGGCYINNAIDNLLIGCSFELNLGTGLKFGPLAKGHQVYSLYTEANSVAQVVMDAGSSRNTIWGYRSGISSDEVVDNSTGNTVFGSFYNVPRIEKMTFGRIEFLNKNYSEEGRWDMQKVGQNLIVKATNTALPSRLYVQHDGGGVAGLGLKLGGNNAVITDIVSKTITVDFGTALANSTKYVDVSFPEIHDSSMTLQWQPTNPTLPDGIIFFMCQYKADGEIRFRLANITSANINVGSVQLIVKGIKTIN